MNDEILVIVKVFFVHIKVFEIRIFTINVQLLNKEHRGFVEISVIRDVF